MPARPWGSTHASHDSPVPHSPGPCIPEAGNPGLDVLHPDPIGTPGSDMTDDLTGLRFDHAALLTIDVQNDFTLEGAPLEVPGTRAAVPAMRRVVTAFRRRGRPVVHVVRLYLPDGSNVDLPRRREVEEGARYGVPGTPGSQLVEALRPAPETQLDPALLLSGGLQQLGPDEWAMYKPRWGAFFETPLRSHLRELGIDSVVVCGCNFPNCPRTTLYEASERDLRVGLVTDATSGLYPRARRELTGIGVQLLDAATCEERLGAVGAPGD